MYFCQTQKHPAAMAVNIGHSRLGEKIKGNLRDNARDRLSIVRGKATSFDRLGCLEQNSD